MCPERQKPKYSLQLTFKRSLFPAICSLLKGINKMMDLTKLKNAMRASLVAQWLRVCLPMQGTRVRALVWEDPTCL